ncbi:MAG: phosphatase PAP2 family protein [Ignavibacteriae bacterium]|nr:phosphatase PAP2 family protein [Ignavibacteriota bacterium]
MLNSGLWIRFGKLLAGRERPSAAYEYSHHPSGIWRGPIHQLTNEEKRSVASYDAFPSGHTATIFSIATVFAEQYKDIPIVPIISYSFATIVGISRMIEHTHWASDVFLGGVIGYLCGKTTIDFYRQKEHYTNKKIKFAFIPSITPQNYGADVVMNF